MFYFFRLFYCFNVTPPLSLVNFICFLLLFLYLSQDQFWKELATIYNWDIRSVRAINRAITPLTVNTNTTMGRRAELCVRSTVGNYFDQVCSLKLLYLDSGRGSCGGPGGKKRKEVGLYLGLWFSSFWIRNLSQGLFIQGMYYTTQDKQSQRKYRGISHLTDFHVSRNKFIE